MGNTLHMPTGRRARPDAQSSSFRGSRPASKPVPWAGWEVLTFLHSPIFHRALPRTPPPLQSTRISQHSKPLKRVPKAGWQLSGNTFHPGREDRAPPSGQGTGPGLQLGTRPPSGQHRPACGPRGPALSTGRAAQTPNAFSSADPAAPLSNP